MEHWYVWLIFGAVLVLTVWMLHKASAALQAHNAETKKMYDEIARLKALKEKFSKADREFVLQAEPQETADGFYAVLEAQIQKAPDANGQFRMWNPAQQTVYTAHYFLVDVEDSLSAFFKKNTEPLTGALLPMVQAVCARPVFDCVQDMYAMYDDQNEEASLDAEAVERINRRFCELFSKDDFLNALHAYCAEHADDLLA